MYILIYIGIKLMFSKTNDNINIQKQERAYILEFHNILAYIIRRYQIFCITANGNKIFNHKSIKFVLILEIFSHISLRIQDLYVLKGTIFVFRIFKFFLFFFLTKYPMSKKLCVKFKKKNVFCQIKRFWRVREK